MRVHMCASVHVCASVCVCCAGLCVCVRMHVCSVCVCTVYACLFTVVLYIQLWLCLGALCVIDEHHAEVLSSGQWMGQDGKPRTKVATLDKSSYTPNNCHSLR